MSEEPYTNLKQALIESHNTSIYNDLIQLEKTILDIKQENQKKIEDYAILESKYLELTKKNDRIQKEMCIMKEQYQTLYETSIQLSDRLDSEVKKLSTLCE